VIDLETPAFATPQPQPCVDLRVKEAHNNRRQVLHKRRAHSLRYQGREFKMNTLRTLSFVGVLTLLLLWPAFASASVPTCPAGHACTLVITSGTMTFDPGVGTFTVGGQGWTSSGKFGPPADWLGFDTPFDTPLPGPWSFFWQDTSEGPPGNLSMSFTLGGVPWTAPGADTEEGPGNFVAATDISTINITHPGIYHGLGSFEGHFVGVPASVGTCPPVGCTGWAFFSRGAVLVDVIDAGDVGLVVDKATWTFKAPEPSTTSLLLLALGALGFQGWARVRREQRVN